MFKYTKIYYHINLYSQVPNSKVFSLFIIANLIYLVLKFMYVNKNVDKNRCAKLYSSQMQTSKTWQMARMQLVEIFRLCRSLIT